MSGPPKISRLDEPTAQDGGAAFRKGLEHGLEEARTAAGSPPQGSNGLAPALRARPRLTVTCSALGSLQARSRPSPPSPARAPGPVRVPQARAPGRPWQLRLCADASARERCRVGGRRFSSLRRRGMALEALQALRPLPRPALRLAALPRAFPGPDVLKRKQETFCFPPRDLQGIFKSFDLSQSKKEPPRGWDSNIV